MGVRLTVKTSKRTRQKPEQRRAEILREATRLIGERGYQGFSLQELTKRCGLKSNAAVLHYFRSKELLLAALLEQHVQFLIDIAALRGAPYQEGAPAGPPMTLEGLVVQWRAIIETESKEPHYVRLHAVLGAEALDRDHPAHSHFVEREQEAQELLTRVLEPHVLEPASTARQLIAMMRGLELQWIRSEFSFDLVAEWDRAMTALLSSAVANARKIPPKKTSGPQQS